MTQPKRDSATRAAKRILSEESLRAIVSSPCGGGAREHREMIATLLEIAVLIERGASRRKQDGVAGARERRRACDRGSHVAGVFQGDRTSERFFDGSGGF